MQKKQYRNGRPLPGDAAFRVNSSEIMQGDSDKKRRNTDEIYKNAGDWK